MRSIRFRIIFPIIFGFLAIALFAWDYQNSRIYEEMAGYWDAGPPFWPYQAVPLLLFNINMPVYLFAYPFVRFLHLYTLTDRALILFPMIVYWWRWIGARLDYGVLGQKQFKYKKIMACVFILSAFSILCFGGYQCF